jgi:protoporphyrinogen oxidase
MSKKTAIIIGAGPAGLTAASELVEHTDIEPVVLEMTDDIGGISKTVNYKGNRMDIGGHRFFSKSDRVMQWWLRFFPLQGAPARDDRLLGRDVPLSPEPNAPDPETADRVMLSRPRVSRILYERTFYDYPISLNWNTVSNLGPGRLMKTAFSYGCAHLKPIRNVASLEDFFINRFGRELYLTFFKDYTEKVWGIACNQISPEWGQQRVRGLSLSKAVADALVRLVVRDGSVGQKKTETSLIQQFLYPKLGPGQLWEQVADYVQGKGGSVQRRRRVVGLKCRGRRIVEVRVQDPDGGEVTTLPADYVFSSMPVVDLLAAMDEVVPPAVRNVARGLMYRDFITVGLLVDRLNIRNQTKMKTVNDVIPDNWIYIQERDVKLGRLQIFNNWSPYMVQDPSKVWLGLEYFCNEGDALWSKPDGEFSQFAADELAKIGVIDRSAVLDSVVVRVPKSYPAYFGTYSQFPVIRGFVDQIENLFLVGRNGMHRYNNQDHSMLTAMAAVENIAQQVTRKDNVWDINAEQEYHEAKSA